MCRQFRFVVRLLIYIAVIVLQTEGALAVSPAQISVQGKMTDSAGNPVPAGTRSFVFRIFNASSGGTQIWPAGGAGDVQNIPTDADGLWTAMLGGVTALTGDVFADTSRWLEITVDAVVLSPRTRIGAASRAATIDGAAGGTVSGAIVVTGAAEGLRLQGSGIGNANEAFMRFTDAAGLSSGYIGDAHPSNPDVYLLASTGDLRFYTLNGEVLRLGASGQTSVLGTGSVGIGTSSPASKLDVRGDIRLGSSGQYRAVSGDENLRIIRGSVTLPGWGETPVIAAGSGFTVSKADIGNFTIFFTTPFASPPSVTSTVKESVAVNEAFAMIGAVSASSAVIHVYGRSDGSFFDRSFEFIAIGPR